LLVSLGIFNQTNFLSLNKNEPGFSELNKVPFFKKY
jgi:hypothetical protein